MHAFNIVYVSISLIVLKSWLSTNSIHRAHRQNGRLQDEWLPLCDEGHSRWSRPGTMDLHVRRGPHLPLHDVQAGRASRFQTVIFISPFSFCMIIVKSTCSFQSVYLNAFTSIKTGDSNGPPRLSISTRWQCIKGQQC